MKGTHTFGKQEKLKSRKLIEQLFAEGKTISAQPLRLVYICPSVHMKVPVKTGVSVSTRNFKKAVDRNRIKRLLREAYRLNKVSLFEHAEKTGRQFSVFIIYTDKALPELPVINDKMKVILSKLIKATSEVSSKNT